MFNSFKILGSITAVIIAAIFALSYQYYRSENVIDSGSIRIPITDSRQYQRLELDNGLSVLLVSDSKAEKSAAALSVNAGSWQDPVEFPGLAHFLEHMLFLGTEKYPDPNDYSNFIQSHGGQQNAFTTNERTSYFFDVESGYFTEALDRFAQFFIAPLFDESLVNRERNAVDAEFNMGLQQDRRRIYDAFQTAINPEHPDAKFSVGNLDTLPEDTVRDALIEFYAKYYSSDQMSLVIYSDQPLNKLKVLAESLFEPVAKVSNAVTSYPALFRADQLPSVLQIKSIKDLRELSFSFPVSGPNHELANKPHKLISWILNQEYKGSLANVLKTEGLADSMSAGVTANTYSETTFDIRLQLTKKGEKQLEQIGTLIFDAIQTLEQNGISAWQFNEIQRLQALRFEYQEAYQPINYALRLSSQMQHYSEFDTLFGPYSFQELNASAVDQYLSSLTPDNVLVTYVSPNAETTDRTKYYNTEFDLNRLSNDWLETWKDQSVSDMLAPAQPNAFVPDQLTLFTNLKQPSELYPYLPDTLIDEPALRLWHLQTTQFNSPKVDVRLSLRSDWFQSSIERKVATQLYLELVKDALDDISRDATLAGLGYGIWLESQGVAVRVYGYQDKLGLYTDVIANELVSHDINPERFKLIQDRLIRQLKNHNRDRLTSQMYQKLNHLLVDQHSNYSQLASAMDQLTPEAIMEVQAQLSGQVSLQAMTVGNLVDIDAEKLARRMAANFSANETALPGTSAVMSLDRLTAHYQFKSNQTDSGILVYYQGESDSFREQAIYSLLNQLIQAEFFNQLRTEKQLGYVVQATDITFHQLPGIGFIIQSPTVDPGLLLLHIDKFLKEFVPLLTAMDDSGFEQYKSGLITQLTQPDKNLLELSGRYWNNVRYQVPHFNMQKRIALEVEKISLTGLIRFYQNQLLSPDAKRIIIYHAANKHKESFDTNKRIRAGDRVLDTAEQYQSARPKYEF